MDKWISFYARYFPVYEDAQAFVEACEQALDAARPSMLIMHQTQRLASLADEVEKICKGDALRLLFLLICAEAVTKLEDGFNEEGKSRLYTRAFFSKFVCDADVQALNRGFSRPIDSPQAPALTVEQIVDILYAVRCSVVHEGRYWDFHFATEFPMLLPDLDLQVSMNYPTFRDLIVRSAITAAKRALPKPPSGCHAA